MSREARVGVPIKEKTVVGPRSNRWPRQPLFIAAGAFLFGFVTWGSTLRKGEPEPPGPTAAEISDTRAAVSAATQGEMGSENQALALLADAMARFPGFDASAVRGLRAGDGVSAADLEWQSFPRDIGELESDLMNGQLNQARRLYRDKRLNPADVYIPRDTRSTLQSLVEARADLLAECERLIREAGMRELRALAESGRARYKTKADIEASKTESQRASDAQLRVQHNAYLKSIGKAPKDDLFCWSPTKTFGYSPYFMYMGVDKVFLADIRELPAASNIHDFRSAAYLEAAGLLIGWFSAVGVLDEKGVVALHTSFEGYLDKIK